MKITRVEGKYNEALVYTDNLEKSARDQLKRMCDYEFTKDSKIRIMPDVHAGLGCTIGTTMTVEDKVVPNIVGVDIGCGVYCLELGKDEIDLEKFDQACKEIPSGRRVWDREVYPFDFSRLNCYRELKNMNWLKRSLGSLGGGNHFIEINQAKDGTKYLVIHTGSRNLGKQVADYYQKLAVDLHRGKEDYFRQKEEIISTYKEEGRRDQIEKALKKIKWQPLKPDLPKDLCYLYGDYLKAYIEDVDVCQDYARLNRESIAQSLVEKMGLEVGHSFHTVHNYIDIDEMIIRKGAVAAYENELILIPINMRDGCILARGRGNEDWNYSAPHGAGRLMSRREAREVLDFKDFKESMEGIYSTSIKKKTLDEAPMAYKPVEEILDAIGPTAQVIELIRPIYNFKA